jgi:hypothetical protein
MSKVFIAKAVYQQKDEDCRYGGDNRGREIKAQASQNGCADCKDSAGEQFG